MKRLYAVLRKTEFLLLLFCACLALFSWPLMTIAANRGGGRLTAYLFIAWGAIIACLFLAGRAIALRERERDER